MRQLTRLMFVFAAATPLSAQVPRDFESPRATMLTFLGAVNAVRDGDEGAIDRAIASLDLSTLGATAESDAARTVTRQLWSALNRIRLVEASQLPGTSELRATESTFIYFPRAFDPLDEAIRDQVDIGDRQIAFARQPDGRWLFSATTVTEIAALSAALSALPPQVAVDEESLEAPAWVRQFMPESLRAGQFAGVRYWQWLVLVTVLFLAFLADLIARSILRPAVHRTARQFGVEVDRRTTLDLVRALGLLAAAIVLVVLFPALAFVDTIGDIARSAVGVFAVLSGTLAAWRLTDLAGFVLLEKSKETASKFDDVLVPLGRKTAKVFIVAFGIIYGAQFLKINIVPLLTGLGIGGLAFAFAAKDTIENLFGSVAVILDQPFEVGDWIVTGDVEGTVEQMGFRSTRVRTFYNSQVTIPNAVLVRATVDNYGRRQYRRWKTILGVQYDTSPELLLAFTEGIRELVKQHPYTRKDYYQVWCNDFADSSINILLYVFHEVPDWSTELRERERLLIDIVRLADNLGVQFAFPTQTLHVFREEHGAADPRYPAPGDADDRRAMQTGARTAAAIVEHQSWRRDRPGPVRYTDRPADGKDGGDAGE